MSKVFSILCLIVLMCSCVSKSEYDSLFDELREKNNQITDLQNDIFDLKIERDELNYRIAVLEENIDDLKSERDDMQHVMKEAHDNYYFFGATDFFTRCAIDELKKYY